MADRAEWRDRCAGGSNIRFQRLNAIVVGGRGVSADTALLLEVLTFALSPRRPADRVYILHAFQKKSKHGIATPQAEFDLIKHRLKQAIAMSEGQE